MVLPIVYAVLPTQSVKNAEIIYSRHFLQKLRENNVIKLFSWNIFWSKGTVWISTMKRNHTQKIPSNQLFSYLFRKNVDLTEIMLIWS